MSTKIIEHIKIMHSKPMAAQLVIISWLLILDIFINSKVDIDRFPYLRLFSWLSMLCIIGYLLFNSFRLFRYDIFETEEDSQEREERAHEEIQGGV